MKFQIGAMTLGDILDRSLKMLLANLAVFYFINLIVLSPVILFSLLSPALLASMDAPGSPLAQVGPFAIGGFLVLILTVVLQPIGTAAILHLISQEYIDQPVSMGSAFRFALGRFGGLFATSLLMGLVLIVGFLLCIVPGIIFAVWYIFFAQIVVVEHLTGTSALGRSKTLTEGYRGRVIGLLAVCFIIGIIFGIFDALMQKILPSVEIVPVPKKGQFDLGLKQIPIYPNYWIHVIVNQLINILISTYQAICVTLLYFDLRNRKEGFDLEIAARGEVETIPEQPDL